jgi:hypothetical protein
MQRKIASSLGWFLVELILYAALVTGYYLLVLRYLGDWLSELYRNDRRLYAAIALTLIIGQGFFLELLTRALLGRIQPRRDAE